MLHTSPGPPGRSGCPRSSEGATTPLPTGGQPRKRSRPESPRPPWSESEGDGAMRKPVQFVLIALIVVLGGATAVLYSKYRKTTADYLDTKSAEETARNRYSQTIDAIAEIQDSLNAISVGENEMVPKNLQSEQKLSPQQGQEALDRIEVLRSSIARNKQRIEQLEASLKKSGVRVNGLEKMVKNLKADVADKESQVATLTTQVNDLQTQVT